MLAGTFKVWIIKDLSASCPSRFDNIGEGSVSHHCVLFTLATQVQSHDPQEMTGDLTELKPVAGVSPKADHLHTELYPSTIALHCCPVAG